MCITVVDIYSTHNDNIHRIELLLNDNHLMINCYIKITGQLGRRFRLFIRDRFKYLWNDGKSKCPSQLSSHLPKEDHQGIVIQFSEDQVYPLNTIIVCAVIDLSLIWNILISFIFSHEWDAHRTKKLLIKNFCLYSFSIYFCFFCLFLSNWYITVSLI